ncbi:type III secretion system stator protein SctL [Pseudomonas gingeri]|nr:type III secretion system stator protein SctL [Pseudomonas gingeri]
MSGWSRWRICHGRNSIPSGAPYSGGSEPHEPPLEPVIVLSLRRLSLGASALPHSPIVRLEQLAQAQEATDVLAAARAEAERLLADAREQCQRYLDQALGQFWEQANGFLQALDSEREALHQEVLVSAESVLVAAMTRLFGETGPAERVRALVGHLAGSQRQAVSAVLSCSPGLFDEVQAWLASSRFAQLWQLREDAFLGPQALRLSSDTGTFELDWEGLVRCLSLRGE